MTTFFNANGRKEYVASLFEGLSLVEVRALSVAALRDWKRRPANEKANEFSVHADYGRILLSLLVERQKPKTTLNDQFASECFLHPHTCGLDAVDEFFNWFVRAGFANRRPHDPKEFEATITYELTTKGRRFLTEGDDDHPFLPGAVQRTASRCPGLPDGVVSLLADAQACLDAMLTRPAIVLLGVAYELAVEHVADALIAKGKLDKAAADMKAAKRLLAIEAKLEELRPGKTPEALAWKGAAQRACLFGHQLRDRRNDAAHTSPTWGFEDREEVEEFLVSAWRHLPDLWAIGLA